MDEHEANLIVLHYSPASPTRRSNAPSSVASYSIQQKMVQSCKNCKYSFRTEYNPNAEYCSKDCETSYCWFMKKTEILHHHHHHDHVHDGGCPVPILPTAPSTQNQTQAQAPTPTRSSRASSPSLLSQQQQQYHEQQQQQHNSSTPKLPEDIMDNTKQLTQQSITSYHIINDKTVHHIIDTDHFDENASKLCIEIPSDVTERVDTPTLTESGDECSSHKSTPSPLKPARNSLNKLKSPVKLLNGISRLFKGMLQPST